MSRPDPRVSVIIPAYNAVAFLAETLESLSAQSFTDWEALIVDDGSTDGTAELAHRYAEQDPRYRLLRQPNSGVSAARNQAISQARGEFVAFLDADDVWSEEKLERQVAVMAEHETVDVTYCAPIWCDENCRPLFEPDWTRYCGLHTGDDFFVLQYTSFFLLPSTVMVRRRVLRETGGFDATLRNAEDCEMWLRLSQAGYRFFGTPEALLLYRRHPGNLSMVANFDAALSAVSRYSGSPLLGPRQRPKPFRLHFRNSFTYLGRNHRVAEAKAMYDAYRPHDRDGYACRVMGVLRHLLPLKLFWVVCRYFIIPLAWQLEGLAERTGLA